ncbi:MAG TPA: lipid droplet-associated protein [Actinophytocola sp.]|uniref:lipid droplet-associated protein n=1 Tax=Actinophytocola sp. TaxID=1872138 RepID=UPI002DDD9D49|nr:lipid droplet-associated protein [Actinophytocola sp.]HEV2779541.1 lipid droplet-associated protein [Actinophytocola sp.]
MKSLPLPIRVAAGLAVTAVEHARELPAKLAGLPVTVASQALQMSMRLQQQVTELAIRGDEVLSALRPVEETPDWATFDEDADTDRYDASRPAPFDQVAEWADISGNGHQDTDAPVIADGAEPDPWAQEERALAEETAQDAERTAGPAGIANYDELSLPQLRARLRRFTLAELEELLEHERTHANRPSFVGMLTRRIATVRDLR